MDYSDYLLSILSQMKDDGEAVLMGLKFNKKEFEGVINACSHLKALSIQDCKIMTDRSGSLFTFESEEDDWK